MILIWNKFKRINYILFPLKSSENVRFSDGFIRNISYLIRSNSLNVRIEIWRWSRSVFNHNLVARRSFHSKQQRKSENLFLIYNSNGGVRIYVNKHICCSFIVNSFHATGPLQYPQKTLENLWFFMMSSGCMERPEAWNGLMWKKFQAVLKCTCEPNRWYLWKDYSESNRAKPIEVILLSVMFEQGFIHCWCFWVYALLA